MAAKLMTLMKQHLLALVLLPLVCCTRTEYNSMVRERLDSPVISNDISNNRVTSFAEDARGQIWIGTFRGLNKSTVHEFHQYFCTEDSLSITDNQIQTLHRDRGGRLWVGTVNGLCLYTDRDDFRRIPMDSDCRNIVQILEDKSGRIFANNSESLFAYDEDRCRLVPVVERLDWSRPYFSRCFIGPSDDVFVVSSSEIRCYGPDVRFPKWSMPLRNADPYYSFMSQDGVILLCSSGRVEAFDTKARKYADTPIQKHPLLRNSYVDLIFQFAPDMLLFNTRSNGLFMYNRSTGEICGQNDGGFPFKAPDFMINTIFRDSRDNLWIGSYDQAYSVVYNYKERFNTDAVLRSAFENVSVYSVDCDDDGNLWCVTLRNELYVYAPESNMLKKLPSVTQGLMRLVCAGHGDEIWIGTFNSVLKFRWKDGRLTRLAEYPVQGPISMARGDDGMMWIGTAGSMVYGIGEDGMREYGPLSQGYTFGSAIMPLGTRLLVGAFKEGLCEVSAEDGYVRKARVEPSFWDACIKRSVFVPTCLFCDSLGEIWVGTMANGLLRYIPDTGEIMPVQGAPCTDICSIEEDLLGNLWVSTQYGLGKYDRSVSEFINWYTADGIGGNQFYDRSSCMMKDGRIVFGGTHGITVFDPIDVMPDREMSVCFENIKVHNRLVRPSAGGCIGKALPCLPEIRLEHRQNSFSISFSALEYGEYERVHYFYRMDGFDSYWIDAGNNREAYYANLPPGKYRFKVRITDNDSNTVLAENSIPVVVKSPLWLSWWALLLYAGFLGFVVWGLLRMRRQIFDEKRAREREMMEKIQEKKVNEMNMNFFANISHEFRTPLTMISGPVTQLRQSESVSEEDRRMLNIVQRNIRRMLRLVNQLLDFNKMENDTLRLQVRKVDIISQLRDLADIFRVTAEEKGIAFKAYGLEDSLEVWTDDDKLDKICFNLLSNAMKFTASGGKVELSLDMLSREDAMTHFALKESDADSRWVKIAVRDTGPGVPEDQLERIFERYWQLGNQVQGSYNWGTGIGLYFARTLALMHHGYLKAANRASCRGAEFTLLLPASESSYAGHEKAHQGGAGLNVREKSIKYTKLPDDGKNIAGQTVLVVDDDADVAHWLNELLSPYYRVITRFDADSAYVFMKEEAPDVVVSDVVMPGKTGYELCRQIKDDIQLSHIPVILLTAKATVENQVEGLECGADSYVTKPFEPKYLLALIDSLLKNREKIKSMLGEATEVESLEENVLSPQDNAFMTELYQLMENELSNSELDVARMTEMLHISRTKFYYKVKGLTGENPSVFFRMYRLNRAAQLLKERKYNVSEIADMTGFSTLSHFSVSFKKQFGVSPSEYVK